MYAFVAVGYVTFAVVAAAIAAGLIRYAIGRILGR